MEEKSTGPASVVEPSQYNLGDLIAALVVAAEERGPEAVVPLGFRGPHSYRGFYDELAFRPATNVTLGSMLVAARSAVGQTFAGYRGGEYTMGEDTQCWLATYGSTGESLGRVLLSLMLAKQIIDEPLDVIDAAAERYDPRHLLRVNAELRRKLQTERERSAKVSSVLRLWTDKSDGHLPGVCFAQDSGGVCQCSDLRRALWAQVVEVLR